MYLLWITNQRIGSDLVLVTSVYNLIPRSNLEVKNVKYGVLKRTLFQDISALSLEIQCHFPERVNDIHLSELFWRNHAICVS